MKKLFCFATALLSGIMVMAQGTRLQTATPEQMGMSSERLTKIDAVVEKAIKDTVMPGAVVCVVRGDKVVFLKAYGNKAIYPKKEKMTVNTVFDMASCSKCIGTTLSFMQLIESLDSCTLIRHLYIEITKSIGYCRLHPCLNTDPAQNCNRRNKCILLCPYRVI